MCIDFLNLYTTHYPESKEQPYNPTTITAYGHNITILIPDAVDGTVARHRINGCLQTIFAPIQRRNRVAQAVDPVPVPVVVPAPLGSPNPVQPVGFVQIAIKTQLGTQFAQDEIPPFLLFEV